MTSLNKRIQDCILYFRTSIQIATSYAVTKSDASNADVLSLLYYCLKVAEKFATTNNINQLYPPEALPDVLNLVPSYNVLDGNFMQHCIDNALIIANDAIAGIHFSLSSCFLSEWMSSTKVLLDIHKYGFNAKILPENPTTRDVSKARALLAIGMLAHMHSELVQMLDSDRRILDSYSSIVWPAVFFNDNHDQVMNKKNATYLILSWLLEASKPQLAIFYTNLANVNLAFSSSNSCYEYMLHALDMSAQNITTFTTLTTEKIINYTQAENAIVSFLSSDYANLPLAYIADDLPLIIHKLEQIMNQNSPSNFVFATVDHIKAFLERVLTIDANTINIFALLDAPKEPSGLRDVHWLQSEPGDILFYIESYAGNTKYNTTKDNVIDLRRYVDDVFDEANSAIQNKLLGTDKSHIMYLVGIIKASFIAYSDPNFIDVDLNDNTQHLIDVIKQFLQNKPGNLILFTSKYDSETVLDMIFEPAALPDILAHSVDSTMKLESKTSIIVDDKLRNLIDSACTDDIVSHATAGIVFSEISKFVTKPEELFSTNRLILASSSSSATSNTNHNDVWQWGSHQVHLNIAHDINTKVSKISLSDKDDDFKW